MKIDVQGPGLELRQHIGEGGVVSLTVRTEGDQALGCAVFELRDGLVVLRRAHDSMGLLSLGERRR